MIFNVTKGNDPYGLVHYLLLKDPERVAWVAERNIMTTDPGDVVARMRAVTALSSRVQQPIYHVSASWHPGDSPTPEQMETVADRVREVLGFDAHQIFVVAHDDTDHKHIHMVFNRVSPETGTALTMSHDYKRLDQLGRALEQEYGWTHVRSPFLDQGAGMDRPIPAYTNGEVHAQKVDRQMVVDHRRELLGPEFRAARDWGDLEQRLRAHGYLLESTGRGLVVTDGDIRTSASRIAREYSYMNLAERFGQPYDAWRVDQGRVRDPLETVVSRLTARDATFTERDLAREVYKVTRNAREHWQVRESVLADPRIVELGVDPDGRTRFASVEQLAAEIRVTQYVAALADRPDLPVSSRVAIEAAAPLEGEEQRRALHSLVYGKGRISALGGLAGTGKSVVAGRATTIWQGSGYTVVGAAAYGKQAEDLGRALGVPSRTLASWEGSWSQGRDRLTDRHVIAVDESGLLDTRQMEKLLARALESGAKVVLVGDPPQLNPVGPGMPFRQVLHDLGAPRLEDVRRQREPWQQDATVHFSEGRADRALDAYDRHGMLHWHSDRSAARVAAAADWFRHRQAEPQEHGLMIAYSNADVRALNKAAREWMRQTGMLGEDRLMSSSYGRMLLAEGDQIMFRQNDRSQGLVVIDGTRSNGVTNGTIGTVESIVGSDVVVRLHDGRAATFNAMEYRAFHHAYAITAHKSQGITVDRSFLVVTEGYDRSLAYTNFSRHRYAVDAYVDGEAFRDRRHLARALSKANPATNALDFIERTAARHLLPQSVLETAVPLQPVATRRQIIADLDRLPEAARAVDGITSRLSRLGLTVSSSLFYLRSLASEPESFGPAVSLQLEARPHRSLGHDRSAEWATDDRTRREDRARSGQHEERGRGADRTGGDRDGYEMEW